MACEITDLGGLCWACPKQPTFLRESPTVDRYIIAGQDKYKSTSMDSFKEKKSISYSFFLALLTSTALMSFLSPHESEKKTRVDLFFLLYESAHSNGVESIHKGHIEPCPAFPRPLQMA